jgi:hypothetical protein
MNRTKLALAGAALGVLLTTSFAPADETRDLAGAWKLVAFFTEDVQTKAKSHVYGEHPDGFLAITPGGRFYSFATVDWHTVPSRSNRVDARSIFYSGMYRLDGNKFILSTRVVSNEGWEGTDPFDMSWSEGWMGTEQVRFYKIGRDGSESERLSMETASIPNPNGAGNWIVGKLIWERK